MLSIFVISLTICRLVLHPAVPDCVPLLQDLPDPEEGGQQEAADQDTTWRRRRGGHQRQWHSNQGAAQAGKCGANKPNFLLL